MTSPSWHLSTHSEPKISQANVKSNLKEEEQVCMSPGLEGAGSILRSSPDAINVCAEPLEKRAARNVGIRTQYYIAPLLDHHHNDLYNIRQTSSFSPTHFDVMDDVPFPSHLFFYKKKGKKLSKIILSSYILNRYTCGCTYIQKDCVIIITNNKPLYAPASAKSSFLGNPARMQI